MYRIAILLGVLSLAGCSLSGVIESSSKDYNVTIEYVTNNMLVENILRARDQNSAAFHRSVADTWLAAVASKRAGQCAVRQLGHRQYTHA